LLTQISATSIEGGVGSRLGHSVAIDEGSGVIVAGMPGRDAESFQRSVNFLQSQIQGYLPAAGSAAVFMWRKNERFSDVTADFTALATSISVTDAATLLNGDTSATISIGENDAIEVRQYQPRRIREL
jgi:hypothetical protein